MSSMRSPVTSPTATRTPPLNPGSKAIRSNRVLPSELNTRTIGTLPRPAPDPTSNSRTAAPPVMVTVAGALTAAPSLAV